MDAAMGDTSSAENGSQAMDNKALISLKVLGEHVLVGAVIGKQGSTISEVQQASEAKIQISGPSDVFPGTTERIIHLSGEMLKVLSALHMVLARWKSEAVFADMPEIGPDQVQLRFCMLGKLCGAVIGEAGRNINDIKEATNTEIKVQGRDECARGVQERIVTVVGEENHVLQAVGRILKVCMADPAFDEYRTQPFTTGGNHGLQNLRLLPNDPLADVPCHFTLQLTNEQAGAVLGMKGANITSIIKMSNAKLSIQSRNDVPEGGLRNLDIQGQLDSSTMALGMVMSKLRDTGRAREARRSTSQ